MKINSSVSGKLGASRIKLYLPVFLCLVILSGCATKLTNYQERELEGYRAKGKLIEEKSPGAAVVLGILPGGGSFYTRQYGIGFVDLLFWPLSILWDPVNGYNSAHKINYYATKESVKREMKAAIKELDYDYEDKKISEREYILKKRAIEAEYTVD